MPTTRRAPSRYASQSRVDHFMHLMQNFAQIAEMYQRQALAQTKGGKKKGGDGDDGFW